MACKYSFFVTFLLLANHVYGYFSSDVDIYAILPADLGSVVKPNGGLELVADRIAKIRIVGHLDENGPLFLFFTPNSQSCNGKRKSDNYKITEITKLNNNISSGYISFSLRKVKPDEEQAYSICLYDGQQSTTKMYNAPWLKVSVIEIHKDENIYLLPFAWQVAICCILLVLSGLFSGLSLGLMSLDPSELEIIKKAGAPQEKVYAKTIEPLRKRGNFLLCSLLIGNVMVNSTFTILFDNLTNGVLAIIFSTIGIVIFGEIIPQAICSRHGLAVGANTHYITRLFMFITFPLSYPVSKILDVVLGDEIGIVYSKDELRELIRLTADKSVIQSDEANIIAGALQLTNKVVEDIMTLIEDVYMLDINTCLDFDLLTQIMNKGYTRVPVYEGQMSNIINLLNTKDLTLIDPDDRQPLSAICRYYDHQPLFVDHNARLDAMLQDFLNSHTHMAIVQKLHNDDDRDPYYETMGVVTLEDVIEEILQKEIIDETDVMTDNRMKKRSKRNTDDYSLFGDRERIKLPKQLAFVAFQFLSTVEPFSESYLDRKVLRNLMDKNVVFNISPKDGKKSIIFEKGNQTDKFVLILQGQVEVTVGEAGMVFEQGPFSHFGSEAIKIPSENIVKPSSHPEFGSVGHGSKRNYTMNDFKLKTYIPDFTVKPLTEVQYLCINRSQYIAALRTSNMIRAQSTPSATVDTTYEEELKKVNKGANNSNTPLDGVVSPKISFDALRQDFKKSTSSLDRVFNSKTHPFDAVRMRRSGSDAKERSEFYGDGGENAKHKSDKSSLLSSPGGGKSRMSNSSLPFISYNKGSVEEVENGRPERKNSSDAAIISLSPAGAEGGIDNTYVIHELPGSDQPGANGMEPPATATKYSSPAKKNNLTGSGDVERVPLMNQEETPFDPVTSNS